VTTAGNTPLHLAIQSGCTSAAALLLFHGASPTITNEIKESPLNLVEALRQGEGDPKRFNHIFECASDKGNFGNFFDRHVKPDAPIDMIAAIHWAIAHNLDRVIAYLLHIDSHAAEARSPQGWHPLHRAARAG
jgi:ankyrin repeat protein